jgi:Holliday junction DNA helicase RuvA
MIGYLLGVIKDVQDETAIVAVGATLTTAVGYEVHMSQPSLFDLQSKINQTVEVWIYSHVREDAFTLFGFLDLQEKSFFQTLLKINGVGPKLALNILSGGSIQRIGEMIEAEDIKGLTSLPKVGKKTAEQMILALKGKLVIEPRGNEKSKAIKKVHLSEVSSALINLGYKENMVQGVLAEIPEDISIEEGVRRGLQALAQY